MLSLPRTISGVLQTDGGDTGRSTRNSEMLVLGAIVAVYLTLGILYENPFRPLTILSTMPSAGIGAVLALDLFGLPFSGMAVVAMLVLGGISLKNAIMLVDFAMLVQPMRALTPHAAIREADLLRLRLILMTIGAALSSSRLNS